MACIAWHIGVRCEAANGNRPHNVHDHDDCSNEHIGHYGPKLPNRSRVTPLHIQKLPDRTVLSSAWYIHTNLSSLACAVYNTNNSRFMTSSLRQKSQKQDKTPTLQCFYLAIQYYSTVDGNSPTKICKNNGNTCVRETFLPLIC